jgi:hypothetical protein
MLGSNCQNPCVTTGAFIGHVVEPAAAGHAIQSMAQPLDPPHSGPRTLTAHVTEDDTTEQMVVMLRHIAYRQKPNQPLLDYIVQCIQWYVADRGADAWDVQQCCFIVPSHWDPGRMAMWSCYFEMALWTLRKVRVQVWCHKAFPDDLVGSSSDSVL